MHLQPPDWNRLKKRIEWSKSHKYKQIHARAREHTHTHTHTHTVLQYLGEFWSFCDTQVDVTMGKMVVKAVRITECCERKLNC